MVAAAFYGVQKSLGRIGPKTWLQWCSFIGGKFPALREGARPNSHFGDVDDEAITPVLVPNRARIRPPPSRKGAVLNGLARDMTAETAAKEGKLFYAMPRINSPCRDFETGQ